MGFYVNGFFNDLDKIFNGVADLIRYAFADKEEREYGDSMRKKCYLVMMILSMIIFGTIGLFVKNIALSAGEIALSRAVIATIIIGAFLMLGVLIVAMINEG